ncbi:hypothetical protein BJ944DRAFT_264857 [Cunninghamella echinulata]|nr:hypothetical protein BJ944DRAFT_264857 [Cunninghamella echinulata]
MTQSYTNEFINDNREYQLSRNNEMNNNSTNNNNRQSVISQGDNMPNSLQHICVAPKVTNHPCIYTNTSNNNILASQIPHTPIPTAHYSKHNHIHNNNNNNSILQTENTPSNNFVSPTYNWSSHCVNLSQHIYQRGLLEGVGSDIVVKVPAWNGVYHLHRLILDQNDYFQTLLQGGFQESTTNEITLHFEHQPLITSESFNFVLTRLYGKMCDPDINDTNVQTILATCSFFHLDSMNELCIEYMLHSLSERNVFDYLRFADSHMVYGSDRLCDAIFTYLCRELHALDREKLINIPITWLKKIMSSDAFYIPSEFERYLVIQDIIQKHYEKICDEKRLPSPSQLNNDNNNDDDPFSEDDAISTLACGFEKLSNLNTSTSFNHNDEIDNDTKSEIGDNNYIEDDELFTTLETYNDIICHSIYYMHMTFEQLETIQDDINPFTGEAMVPETIIREALWNQIKLRTKIENATEQDKILGITSHFVTPKLAKTKQQKRQSITTGHQLYIIPTSDSTKYTGENAISHANASHALLNESLRSPISSYQHHSEVSSSTENKLDINNNSCENKLQYSIYPPFRFSVEFTDVADLKRNVRVYSKTFFYAGSNWNMYIQKTRSQRKNILQLGVYLHRQSIPSDNCNHQQGNINPNVITRATPTTTNTTQSTLSSSPPFTNTNTDSKQGSLCQDYLSSPSPSSSPSSFSCYKDKRKVTKTWFKIFSPSRGPKHALTLFQSSPDDFKVLQSWGWRSTVLCADETNFANKASTSTSSEMQNKNNGTSTATIRRDTDVFTGIIPLSPSPVNHDMNQQPSQSSSPETISNDESNGIQQNSPVTLRFSVVMGHL